MAHDKCTICGKETALQCKTCQAANYCSIECQKNDFALHKLLCSQYQTFLKTRPGSKVQDRMPDDVKPVAYKAAILFPGDSNDPQLIWVMVHTKSHFDRIDEPKEVPSFHFWESVNTDLKKYMDFPRGVAHSHNDRGLKVYMGDSGFGHSGEDAITKSLLKLNAGYGCCEPGSILPAAWDGSVVVVNITTKKVTHPETGLSEDFIDERERHHNISLSDFRCAFDYLTRDNYIFESDKPNPYVIRKPGRWFKAVKISCDGDIKFEGKEKFIEVDVARRHPMFMKCHGRSSISKQLGFPLFVKRIQPPREWEQKLAKLKKTEPWFGPLENAEADCLMIDAEVTSSNWGFPPPGWDRGEDPTILVARDDMKDLTAHQVEALCYFCSEKLQQVMRTILDREAMMATIDDEYLDHGRKDSDVHIPSSKVRQKFIDNYLLSEMFATFFEAFKQEKIAEGDATWVDATVPLKGKVPVEIEETKQERNEAFVRMIDLLRG